MYDKKRPHQYLYEDKRWAALRKQRLELDGYMCQMCLEIGIAVEATVVDHLTPHKGNWNLFFDITNTQSLCETCHNKHKQILERTGRLPGCDESGSPVDRNHHWNKK